ncbi:MAG: hypothetical protein OIF50_05730 [Flavobacteriaceae bacterium]|nr:hypothetical protein [Flavobacteriaceae bacterium]
MKFVFLRKRYLVFYVYIAIYKEEKSSIAAATVSFCSEIERKKGLFIGVFLNRNGIRQRVQPALPL